MSLIGIFAKFIYLLYISVLRYYSLRLLQNCKSYQLKGKFCGNFLGILGYSPHKTEFNNLGTTEIQAQYLVNLFFEGIFWYSL